MSETYTIDGNALQKILFGNETAQSFSPLEDHTLEYIDIDVFLNSELGIPVPHLYNSDATHEPVGGTASHAIGQLYPKPFKPGLQRLRSYMQPYPIKVGKIYCIKLYGLGTAPEHTFFWQYDKDAATYPRGHRIWRDTEFDPYTHYHDQDYMFAEWGDPPLVKPEPIPPVYSFACTDIKYIHLDGALIMYLATSVPCHLTCYYTATRPRKHPRSRIIRGATLPWGTYFCFVNWQIVEQREEGDTLYHTFVFPGWYEDEKKWFTFMGSVNEIISNSIGPIFEHTHTGQDLIKNSCWSDWPFGDPTPNHWDKFTAGTGFGALTRETTGCYSCDINPLLEAGGFAYMHGLRQRVTARALRDSTLRVKMWFWGFAYSNNGLYIRCDGTGGWGRFSPPTENYIWQELSLLAPFPIDCTYFQMEARAYSPGMGPIYGRPDKITIELR